MTDLCTNQQVSAIAIKTAADAVPQNQQLILLGFTVDGDIVQSASIPTSSTAPATDQKLWIIGAVLGPVAFVLLLICLCCFLHYKFRTRGNYRSSAQVY